MSNPKPFKMAVGNKREVEKIEFWTGFRTKEQFETVRSIVERNEFDFSHDEKIFIPNTISDGYTGPFCFSWKDTNGFSHLTRIGKRGKILSEIVTPAVSIK